MTMIEKAVCLYLVVGAIVAVVVPGYVISQGYLVSNATENIVVDMAIACNSPEVDTLKVNGEAYCAHEEVVVGLMNRYFLQG